MSRRLFNLILAAALFWGAALLYGGEAQAASCCGGGSASSLILPKISHSMIDLSFDYEKYDGYWNKNGTYLHDPPGSNLRQYRMNIGYARRLGDNWQAFASAPLVFNENVYSGLSSSKHGVGDTTLGVWYEAFDNIKCVWKVNDWKDLVPAAYFGGSLLVPTGISPYDNVGSSFDITGRGFYRLDGSMLLDKTVYPWNMSLAASYGVYMERPVNREYGNYVAPYRKKLGDRSLVTVTFGYTYFLDSMDTLTITGALSDLREKDGITDGQPDPSTGMAKRSAALTLAWANMERDWIAKATWSHALAWDYMGSNFPVTDNITLGVTHVFR